jgi:hypothetical protein
MKIVINSERAEEGINLLKVTEKNISIQVEAKKGITTGVLVSPIGRQKRVAIVIAHGAGNDMNTPLITSFSRGLAAFGFPVLRFNFLYAEHGRKTPDKQEILEQTWQSVMQFAREELGGVVDVWIAAGKSMGGRVASQLVADNILPIHGVIFLGYPLHPAGDQEKLRDKHLYRIKESMLFFAGTRDPLCNMGKLNKVLSHLQASHELIVIDGGDHSFHVPKSSGLTEQAIHSQIIKAANEWLLRTFT